MVLGSGSRQWFYATVLCGRDAYLLFDTVYLLNGDRAQPVALTLAVALVALPLHPR